MKIQISLNSRIIQQRNLRVTNLLPVAPLMIEHRVIERMIRIVKIKLEEFKTTNDPSEAFIDSLIDFIHTYADQTHHGKTYYFVTSRKSKYPVNTKRLWKN
jgi:hemerythrin-like domain-containing protein